MKSVRLVLACVLAGLALVKIPALAGSEEPFVLPRWAIAAGAGLELIAACLLMRRNWMAGAGLAMLLGWAFLAAVYIMKVTGMDVSACGCFGRVQVTRWQHALVAGGIALSGASLVAYRLGAGSRSPIA